jgi:hypothetical protein
MMLKAMRFAVLMLAALSMGMAFCHLLEMPPRLGWDAPLWIVTTVPGGKFRLFGSVGAAIETLAWIAAVALAILVRRRRPAAFLLTLVGAVLLVAAFAVWWIFVYPANVQIAGWTPQHFSPDWAAWRAQWEYAHVVRALLLIGGYAALALAVVRETPA